MITGLKNPKLALWRYQNIDEDEALENQEEDGFEDDESEENDEEDGGLGEGDGSLEE
ncbi:MAG: hypothetical protein HYT13_00085 [Candidatus Liptonbacteria bacterium]|nr:hypothetical protein [Candidatus Liptonbacteria bacterium]